jgi:pre-mRNA-splicing factor 18
VNKQIVEKMYEIVSSLKAMDFVKANDAYYRMAIGNSPWPIGVTCVGIHERSAREKISTDQTARIHSPRFSHPTKVFP